MPTMVLLKAELRKLGKPITGNKNELEVRLANAQEEIERSPRELPPWRSSSRRSAGSPKRLVPEGAGKRAVEAVVGRSFSPKQSSDAVRPVRTRLPRLGLTPGRGWRRMG